MTPMGSLTPSRALASTTLTLLSACAGPPQPTPPSLADADPALAALIDASDGIDGVARRVSAFVNGEPVRYWHLGEHGVLPMPVYQPCTEDAAGECVAAEHPLVAGAVPGE